MEGFGVGVGGNVEDGDLRRREPVLGAETAAQALATLASPETPVDLAILDVKLPILGGWELVAISGNRLLGLLSNVVRAVYAPGKERFRPLYARGVFDARHHRRAPSLRRQFQRRGEHQQHRKVHRPWGWYDSIDEGPRFKVKRIMVKPGASLSLQKHHHRAEHWVVVSGTAEVTCGDRKILLSENQSTYIPLGEVHRLANPGKVPLEIIEVQSGSYLGEDDIVRFEDNYGRK